MRLLLLLSILVTAAGCGAMAGGACSGEGAQQCAGSSVLLVCENSKWNSYACPTCAGSTCNWKGAANGDACPHAAETQGTCNLDGRVVSCYWSSTADAGVFVESACPACMAGKSLEELGKCSPQGRCACN
ncbi:MAG: hypothetical protein QM817_17850 [Archangium sp.]